MDPELRNFLDTEQLLSPDPHNLESYLNSGRKEVTKLKAHLSQRLKKCTEDVTELAKLSGKLESIPFNPDTEESIATLSQVLEKAKSHCTHDAEEQTLALLKDHLDYQILKQTKETFVQELRRQLEYMEDSGSERKINISVGLGASAGIPFIKGLSLGLKINYSFKVAKRDDGRTREFHTVNRSVSAKVGDDKVVSVAASGDDEISKGRVFRSTEELLRFHSNDFVPMLVSSLQKLPGNAKGAIDSRRAEKLHSKVTADRQLLSQQLAKIGVIHPGDNIRVTQERPVNYADFSQNSSGATLAVNALAGVVKGNVTLRNKTYQLPYPHQSPPNASA